MASAYYDKAAAKRRSDRGKRMAAERWRRDRERRDKLAMMEPINYPSRIVRRIIVITGEVEVREAILYEFDGVPAKPQTYRGMLRMIARRIAK